jgi:hypothetical protein
LRQEKKSSFSEEKEAKRLFSRRQCLRHCRLRQRRHGLFIRSANGD